MPASRDRHGERWAARTAPDVRGPTRACGLRWMIWLSTIAGVALVATVLWDVFRTLWHPSGQGRLTQAVMRVSWRTSRHLGERPRRLSGPAAMVAVFVAWTGIVIAGWALVYWPHLPESFSYSPGLVPDRRGGLLDAVYLSSVTLATLGFGDIVPTVPVLRLLVPVEALLGFAILTAAVSWVLQVYPALIRRRTLALSLDTYRRTDTAEALTAMDPATAARILGDVADGISQVHVDTLQYAEAYYFRDAGAETTLAGTVDYAAEMAHCARQSDDPGVRHGGAVLLASLDDLAGLLDRQYLHTGAGTGTVLEAYRRDQRAPA